MKCHTTAHGAMEDNNFVMQGLSTTLENIHMGKWPRPGIVDHFHFFCLICLFSMTGLVQAVLQVEDTSLATVQDEFIQLPLYSWHC